MRKTMPPAKVRVNGKLVLYKATPTPAPFTAGPRTRAYHWEQCPKLNWTLTPDGYVCDARE